MSSRLMQDIRSASLHDPQVKDEIWTSSYMFGLGFIGFQGHFPQNPILPAVVQFSLALDAVQNILKMPLRISKVSRAKFTSVLQENMEIQVQVSFTEDEEKIAVSCKIYGPQEQASSFKLELQRG